jgi:hypothetical protein
MKITVESLIDGTIKVDIALPNGGSATFDGNPEGMRAVARAILVHCDRAEKLAAAAAWLCTWLPPWQA